MTDTQPQKVIEPRAKAAAKPATRKAAAKAPAAKPTTTKKAAPKAEKPEQAKWKYPVGTFVRARKNDKAPVYLVQQHEVDADGERFYVVENGSVDVQKGGGTFTKPSRTIERYYRKVA
ncbi:hypothetical protein [Sinomonas sp. B1-1]|uniref:hypothetical protein n=1 Tax=Sinomonas sp. B1-1 TaxID=3141454 RepID=UPI003D2ADB05